MKKQLLETYAPPRVDCVTLCTEQCMNNVSGNGALNDLTPLTPILDEEGV